MSQLETSRYRQYIEFLKREFQISFSSYDDLHHWSINDQSTFWISIARFFSVDFDKPYAQVINPSDKPWETRWFDGAELSYTKHIFSQFSKHRPAIIYQSETNPIIEISWQELYNKTVQLQQQLLAMGVAKGDTVAAYCVNAPETIAAFLAVNGLGAVWSSCSPDFGIKTVHDRLSQLQPKVLFVHSSYTYKGKRHDIRKKVNALQNTFENCECIDLCRDQTFDDSDQNLNQLLQTSVPFSTPIWVLFSSGTTGKPKAIAHGTGAMLLEHQKALAIHQDVCEGDRYFWYSSTAWMMWNYALSSLLCGATLCLFQGASTTPKNSVLWDFAAQAKINHFGHGAVYFQHQAEQDFLGIENRDFHHLKTIGSTGSPLSADTCRSLQHRFPNTQIISLSGGTDICTAFIGGHPEKEVVPGEIQCKMLGAAVEIWNSDGEKILQTPGELVLAKPFLSMPLFLWGDRDNRLLKDSYYGMYTNVWNHGDWATQNESGGLVIHGRSDATLNRQGVRMGTAEIYDAISSRDEIEDSLVIHLTGYNLDALLLFVVLRSTIDEDEIRSLLRDKCSPRHVPDQMIQVPEIPYTLSGKKVEVPIKKLFMGVPPSEAFSTGVLHNPDAIQWFVDYAKNNPFT